MTYSISEVRPGTSQSLQGVPLMHPGRQPAIPLEYAGKIPLYRYPVDGSSARYSLAAPGKKGSVLDHEFFGGPVAVSSGALIRHAIKRAAVRHQMRRIREPANNA